MTPFPRRVASPPSRSENRPTRVFFNDFQLLVWVRLDGSTRRAIVRWYGCCYGTDRCWNRFVFVLVGSDATRRGAVRRGGLETAIDLLVRRTMAAYFCLHCLSAYERESVYEFRNASPLAALGQ